MLKVEGSIPGFAISPFFSESINWFVIKIAKLEKNKLISNLFANQATSIFGGRGRGIRGLIALKWTDGTSSNWQFPILW